MKFIHLSLVLSCFLLGTGCFNIGTSSRQLPFDSTASNNVGITSDIEFLGEGKGKSSQIKILRFFTVGGKNRSSYPREYYDSMQPNGEEIVQSRQAAVHDALDGRSDAFIIDPQFDTEYGGIPFLFETIKTDVNAQIATKSNYRQIKRYTTDQTDTIPVDRLPHVYMVQREGVDGPSATTVTVSRDTPEHITRTIRVADGDGSSFDSNLNLSSQPNEQTSFNRSSMSPSMQSLIELESKLKANRLKLESLLNGKSR